MKQPPIILVGTQRSGTTWLGDLFSRHPRLAYAEEPRHVWTWGNAGTPDDVLTAAHARPKVIEHVRASFERFVASAGKDGLVEKTPSNCLRLPFIRAVFPEAKILLVLRDGRSVIRSTDEIMRKGVPAGRVLKRALETPLWEWPAYSRQAVETLARKVTRRPLRYWGPRPPGWRDWLRAGDHPEVVLAKQWSATITRAVEDGARQDPAGFMAFRYEDLMQDPRGVMARIVAFVGLPDGEVWIEEAARTADPSRQKKWLDQLDAQTLERIRPHMEPTLLRLGYAW